MNTRSRETHAQLVPRRALVPPALRKAIVRRLANVSRADFIRAAHISETTLGEAIAPAGFLMPAVIAKLEEYVATLGGAP